jgi:hypothetical protein
MPSLLGNTGSPIKRPSSREKTTLFKKKYSVFVRIRKEKRGQKKGSDLPLALVVEKEKKQVKSAFGFSRSKQSQDISLL